MKYLLLFIPLCIILSSCDNSSYYDLMREIEYNKHLDSLRYHLTDTTTIDSTHHYNSDEMYGYGDKWK